MCRLYSDSPSCPPWACPPAMSDPWLLPEHLAMTRQCCRPRVWPPPSKTWPECRCSFFKQKHLKVSDYPISLHTAVQFNVLVSKAVNGLTATLFIRDFSSSKGRQRSEVMSQNFSKGKKWLGAGVVFFNIAASELRNKFLHHWQEPFFFFNPS